MIELVNIYLRFLKIDSRKVRVWIRKEKYRHLSIALNRYPHSIRKTILKELLAFKKIGASLPKTLIKIAKFDFLEHSGMAIEILTNSSLVDISRQEMEELHGIFDERTKEKANYNSFLTNHEIKTDRAVFDKTEMIRLAEVKKKLRKSIR